MSFNSGCLTFVAASIIGLAVFGFILKINDEVRYDAMPPEERARIESERATRDAARDAERQRKRLEGEESMAFVMSQDCVRSLLKAPRTAKFPWSADSVSYQGNGRYYVVGHVDAENGFGAMLRNNYSVTMIYDGETWQCSLDLQIQ